MNEENEDEVIRQAMSLVGRRTSERKKQTGAPNGQKGVRPRGTSQSPETRAKIAASHKKAREEWMQASANEKLAAKEAEAKENGS